MTNLSSTTHDVVIVGAGLAGLAAAATLRSGAGTAGIDVVLLDRQGAGGRARTDERSGYLLNRGPHALYRHGPGWSALGALGITPAGRKPPLSSATMLAGGELHSLPTGAVSLARPGWLSARDRVQIGAALMRIMTMTPASIGTQATTSAADWISAQGLRPRADATARALGRLATYCKDLDALSADAMLHQLRTSARHSVLYLHGGWQQLVDALVAKAAPITVESGRVAAVTADGAAYEITTADRTIGARAVIVAVDSPRAAAALLTSLDATSALALAPHEPDAAATAACLDVIARRKPSPTFILGVDEPFYSSTHHPTAQLRVPSADTPEDSYVLQLARYGATSAAMDRRSLEALAAQAGVGAEDVIDSRFFADLTVISRPPSPDAGGMAGRPRVDSTGLPGCYVAGDFVGPHGLLADVSLTSGSEAGRLALEHLATARQLRRGVA
ncbi:MAG: FAD-dependent oxidoreductase [Acidimicrobiales bacterium]